MNCIWQVGLTAIFLITAQPGIPAGSEMPSDKPLFAQMEQFLTESPGSIFALQPFRTEQIVNGTDGLQLKLISLNPEVNSWFVLEIEKPGSRGVQYYHLENPDPANQILSLVGGEYAALEHGKDGQSSYCAPWTGHEPEIETAQKLPLPFVPICNASIYLRNRVSGSRTNREAMAEFLRDNVVFGDSIVNLIKDTFYEDAFLQSSETGDESNVGGIVESLGRAQLARNAVMRAWAFGFELLGVTDRRVEAGSWYAIENAPGIYASVMQPGMIHPDILNRPEETNWLDSVERRADVYLVGFDMEVFDIGYETGTRHPELGWSPRPRGAGRNRRIPGPDGINSPDPLVMSGMLSPSLTWRVAATFTGGFKRSHGAFKYGDMATYNHGNHYGFIVNGVILSRLYPGLSTLFVKTDGTVEMRAWTEDDATLLPELRFARQNGVPLIEPDPETGAGVPGSLVRNWGAGNWSGSADADLRTLRAGACMRTTEGRQFLIYAYFSTATPSAMARTFQAYGCDTAMLLDMNSQEHTYMALYPFNEDSDWIEAEHLVNGMRVVDKQQRDGTYLPRFIGFADNRDFFYLLRKE